MIAFIGVRISWLMLARNIDLARVALSACSRATSSSRCALSRLCQLALDRVGGAVQRPRQRVEFGYRRPRLMPERAA